MTLREWADQRPRGALVQLATDCNVSYPTIMRALQSGGVKTYAVARRISIATGGAVSIAELCEPRPRRRVGR